MILHDASDGMARGTVLSLLLGTTLDPDTPALLDARALDRVLAWSRRQPDGALDLSDAPISSAQRDGLVERRERLDSALAGWRRDGWQVIGRTDPAYPKRLRRRLGTQSPTVFIQGDPTLAACGGIALVDGVDGRDANERNAVLSAMSESTLVLLQRPAGSGSIAIARQSSPAATALLRLSPPGQAPTAEQALDRSCHALADAVVVSGLRRTDAAWDAVVALVAEHRQPVWVTGTLGDAGLLIRAGARPIPPGLLDEGAAALLRQAPGAHARQPGSGDDSDHRAPATLIRPSLVAGFAEPQARFGGPSAQDAPPATRGGTAHLRLLTDAPTRPVRVAAARTVGPTLFELFEEKVATLLSHGPLGAGVIADAMDLTRPQVDIWLLRAETTGTVRFDPQTRLYARLDR